MAALMRRFMWVVCLLGGLLTGACSSGGRSASEEPASVESEDVLSDTGSLEAGGENTGSDQGNEGSAGANGDGENDADASNDDGGGNAGTEAEEGDGDLGTAFDKLPDPPTMHVSFSVKTLTVHWSAVSDVTHYRVFEDPDGVSGFVQISADLPADITSFSLNLPIYARVNAKYLVGACNTEGCRHSDAAVLGTELNQAIAYLKASNTDKGDEFGATAALSADGKTLAIGAPKEDGLAAGINGDELSNESTDAGAVYVYVLGDNGWEKQAYLKAEFIKIHDQFGSSVALSGDGNVLAVGAPFEDSSASGIHENHSAPGTRTDSGAVHLYRRNEMGVWMPSQYFKAHNPGAFDGFGDVVALSDNGQILAVGARNEDGLVRMINGDDNDDAVDSGAVYVFEFSNNNWTQRAYIKASNADAEDQFGAAIALSKDGQTLAVGAFGEASEVAGIEDNDSGNNEAPQSGAAYIFSRHATGWREDSYIKPSTIDLGDHFGVSVALSDDAQTLVVGASWEDSSATGVNGDESDNSVTSNGAAYVFVHDDDAWLQQAYLKPATVIANDSDHFGARVALSGDGNIVLASAPAEQSSATGIAGDAMDNSSVLSGAVFAFTRRNGVWQQRSYIKAKNTQANDHFGGSLACSSQCETVVIGALGEGSQATGLGGDGDNNFAQDAGAVYLY